MSIINSTSISRENRKPLQRSRCGHGFTLVEILVVLVIIGLMGGMVLTAIQGVTTTARASRTRSIIAACDSVIQEKYESYKYRAFAVNAPITSMLVDHDSNPSTPDILVSNEVLVTEAARVRLIMVRDLQRMELPDKQLDVLIPPGSPTPAVRIRAVANRVISNAAGKAIRQYASRSETDITWNRSQKSNMYFERFTSSGSSWSTTYEGAECLYMIMATSFSNGSPAIDSIPNSSIGDLDNDGMPEILDGWGNPLGFIRWPVGFLDSDLVDTTIPDEFDPFQVDFGNSVSSVTRPWAMRPLIVSAGSDQEHGIALSSNSVEYQAQNWPLTDMDTGTATKVGDERLGRSDPYRFPDPFLRHSPPPTSLPGAVTNIETSVDNITNYSLAVSE